MSVGAGARDVRQLLGRPRDNASAFDGGLGLSDGYKVYVKLFKVYVKVGGRWATPNASIPDSAKTNRYNARGSILKKKTSHGYGVSVVRLVVMIAAGP